MPWIYLLIAGLFEIVWAVGLKYSHGMTRLWPTVGTLAAMIATYVFLSVAAKTIPIGTAYAVWTGIGATGTAILGMWLFREPVTVARLVCILLVVSGTLGLKLTAG